MSGLNDFLETLNAQGEQESSGVFTVSLDKAEEKLEKFRLVDPNLFILNLVSVAVLGEATKFEIEYGDEENTVLFDGRRFTQDELDHMYVSDDPGLQELAISLTALKSLEPTVHSFESDGGFTWGKDGRKTSEGVSAGNRLSFRQPSEASWLAKKFRESPRPAWVEALESCELAPLAMTVNGRRSGLDFLFATRRSLHLESDLRSLTVSSIKDEKTLQLGEATGSYTALLGFHPMEHANSITLVSRGVSFTRELDEFNLLGLGGVIYVNHLQKNLSHTDIVEDQTYRELRELIWQDVLRTVPKFCGHLVWHGKVDGWPDIALLSSVALREDGEREKAWKLEAWACAHSDVPDIGRMKSILTKDERLPFVEVFLRFLWFRYRLCKSLKSWLVSAQRDFGLGQSMQDFFGLLADWQREEWMGRILPVFPEEGSWHILRSILLSSDNEKVWKRVEQKLETVQNIYGWPQRSRVLEAQELVSKQRGTCFEKAVIRWLDQGVLVPEVGLERWLSEKGHDDLVKELARRKESMRAKQLLNLAGEQYRRFVYHNSGSLKEIRSRLKEAHSEAIRSQNMEVADKAAVRLRIFGPDEWKIELSEKPWDLCRKGCLAVMAGDLGTANVFYKRAAKLIELDTFKWLAVLRGDLALAQGNRRDAERYYESAISEYAKDLYQREGLAESTKSPKLRLRRWREAAEKTSDALQVYFLKEEAANTAAPHYLVNWVRARVRASFAHHNLLPENQRLVKECKSKITLERFIELSLRHPPVALAVVRRLRKTEPEKASQCLARFRLLNMFCEFGNDFDWDFVLQDDELDYL